LVLGPQWVRNDLRNDLLKLDLLRSYPLPGRAVVAAETAASTLVLTALQLALLVIAYLAFLGNATMEPDLRTRTAVVLASVVCLRGPIRRERASRPEPTLTSAQVLLSSVPASGRPSGARSASPHRCGPAAVRGGARVWAA